MLESPGAAYREVAGWPAPGNERRPGELARLAVEWIEMNRNFILDQLPTEEGFDHRDVISLLMFRAHNGGGLVRPLQAHADGTAPISSPKGLLLRHVFWAAGECRSTASARREAATDWCNKAAQAVPSTWDQHDNPSGYLRLINILTQECGDVLASGLHDRMQHDLREVRQHVTDRLPDLLAIFHRYAPPQVSAEVASWDDDDRACVLLAIFPGQLPHCAVNAYRRLTSGPDGGEITVGATQRKISRLRSRLRMIWPPELVPRGLKASESSLRSDDSEQEEP